MRLPFSVLSKDFEDTARKTCVGAEIRGFMPGEECEGEKCCITGDIATIWGYMARSY